MKKIHKNVCDFQNNDEEVATIQPQQAMPSVMEFDNTKKRASSVRSRTSEVAGIVPLITRTGSLQNKAHTASALVKQDSTNSGFSQVSQSSGEMPQLFILVISVDFA